MACAKFSAMKAPLFISVVAITLFSVASARDSHRTAEHAIHPPASLQWKEGPPALPAGAKFVVLEGDPSREGFFTMRVRMPDGYRIPPHTHPKVERVTVISGTFYIGMGDTFDQHAATEMPAGAFGYWPAGMKHFAWVKSETTVQVHGVGPWEIEYLNPADDPRKNK
jgi:quercetin dioxygenase-like cupin family protein